MLTSNCACSDCCLQCTLGSSLVEDRQTFGIASLNTNCVTKMVMEKSLPNVPTCEWAVEEKGKTWHHCVVKSTDVPFSYILCINTTYITNNTN